jgi:hypothetical protein
MSLDINQQQKDIENKIKALKDYNETSSAEKNILKKVGNSFSDIASKSSTQLNKIAEQKKRYLREPKNSLDRIVDLLTSTRGSGPETFTYLRKILLQTLVTIEPKIYEILSDEIIKSLGCSQEQSYNGFSANTTSFTLLPFQLGNYVPIQSIDLTGMLKLPVDSPIGKMYYEKEVPSTSDEFVPYGGKIKFPINRMLRTRTLTPNETYDDYYGKYYFGKSGQNLFDLTYTQTNSIGVSGDFFRVFLLEREQTQTTSSGFPINQVGKFIKDYYSTIELVTFPQVMATLLNYMTGFVSIKAKIGFGELDAQNKYVLLLQRILGLCFDDRTEIDVSGISKLGELDGVDDSFFEFTEVDLRNIEANISNIQEGVVVFEDCDNVKLPVDVDTIIAEINNISGNTNEELVTSMENVVNSVFEKWKILIPNSASLEVSVNKSFIKNLPIALASSILSPKALLPFIVMLNEVQRSAAQRVNDSIISSANSFLQSGTTIGQQVTNITSDAVDFVKNNRTLVINLVSKISSLFVETLFEILKRDIFQLISVIIKDIQKSQTAKQYAIILRLVQLGYVVARLVTDYRKCKSLLDEITLLLNMISNFRGNSLFRIPAFLNLLSVLLPGYSSERATLNVIEQLQKLGLPTGPMPDGTPNQMNLSIKSLISGIDQEQTENGKVETSLKLPPPYGLLSTIGKSM